MAALQSAQVRASLVLALCMAALHCVQERVLRVLKLCSWRPHNALVCSSGACALHACPASLHAKHTASPVHALVKTAWSCIMPAHRSSMAVEPSNRVMSLIQHSGHLTALAASGTCAHAQAWKQSGWSPCLHKLVPICVCVCAHAQSGWSPCSHKLVAVCVCVCV